MRGRAELQFPPADKDPSFVDDIDNDRIALGIQQPWIELIFRGLKTIEVRSRGTQLRGPIYLYASRKPSRHPAAAQAAASHALDWESLDYGQLIGTVELVNCRPATRRDATAALLPAELLESSFAWELSNPKRFKKPRAVRFLPYGVWFYPFRRKNLSEPK